MQCGPHMYSFIDFTLEIHSGLPERWRVLDWSDCIEWLLIDTVILKMIYISEEYYCEVTA